MSILQARRTMSEQLEVFTAEAVMSGTWASDTDVRDVLESTGTLRLQTPIWTPLEEAASAAAPDELAVDDVIAVVGDTDSRLSIHANWHDVVIDAGPYRITAQLPVLPGFDPGRALTRPGSTFLLIRDAKLELLGRPDAGELERPFALVNRYAVERVASDLVLGFFFPAAHFDTLEGVPAG
jgi:hypothetical protein